MLGLIQRRGERTRGVTAVQYRGVVVALVWAFALAATNSAMAAIIGVDASVSVTHYYALDLSGYVEAPAPPMSFSGKAVSALDHFLGGASGCSATACVYDLNYGMDLTGLTSPQTASFLSSLSVPLTRASMLLVEIRTSAIGNDSVYAMFLERGNSGQLQINSDTPQESFYTKQLELRAYGDFFADLVLPPFTPDSLEALWLRTPFAFLNYSESYSNTTYSRNSSGSYAILSQSGKQIIGGWDGEPNATFTTFAGSVSEPNTFALLGLGLAGIACCSGGAGRKETRRRRLALVATSSPFVNCSKWLSAA